MQYRTLCRCLSNGFFTQPVYLLYVKYFNLELWSTLSYEHFPPLLFPLHFAMFIIYTRHFFTFLLIWTGSWPMWFIVVCPGPFWPLTVLLQRHSAVIRSWGLSTFHSIAHPFDASPQNRYKKWRPQRAFHAFDISISSTRPSTGTDTRKRTS